MKLHSQNGKKIGIFGLGVTGMSVYEALLGIAEMIICYDDSRENIEQFIKTNNKNTIIDITDSTWHGLDKIVISPGVSHNHAIFKLAKKFNIQISSDIDLLYEENPNAEYVVVTGTNGKSTTTSLIYHILKTNGFDNYQLAGNIGIPALSLDKSDGYILELSSFQIDLLYNFAPNIAAILNITPDHLDRYENFQQYLQSKFKILKKADIKILGMDNDQTRTKYNELRALDKSSVISFASGHHCNIECNNNILYDNYFDIKQYQIPENKSLQGRHNQENIAASFAICRLLGVKGDDIINALSGFEGLKHRMQYVKTVNNVSFYNDSKATNSASAILALNSLRNIFWLAGGIYKEDSLDMFNSENLMNVKKIYLFGQSKDLFVKYFDGKIAYEECEALEDAVSKSYLDAKNSKEMASILLAPASASYDQFKNFAHRGDEFIKLVERI